MKTAHDWLLRNASRIPHRTAVREWETGASLTHLDLLRAVDRAGDGLRQRTRPGDRVVLVLPNGLCFPTLLLACVGAGLIAVPAPVPSASRTAAFRERLIRIVEDCRPTLLVTDELWTERVAEILLVAGAACELTTWQELRDLGSGPGGAARLGVDTGLADRIAFLQYTSGSTGRPRGVVVTHKALEASCVQASRAYAEQDGDIAVTWVPLFHDMGLVTALMRPLFTGYPSVLIRPDTFARSPVSWLHALDECEGTLSSAPNFAYELCVRKVPADEVDTINLSRWRVARNAGEVVRPETMDRFVRHFGPAKLSPSAMCPSYGLAEATLTVTTCGPGAPARTLTVSPADLNRGSVVLVADPASAAAAAPAAVRSLLSSGPPVPGAEVRIEPADRTGTGTGTSENVLGEILMRGPQLSPGCWGGDQTPTRREQPDAWRRTGDLGFVHDGDLYVLGRIDDTLVFQGKNFYLADVLAACAPIAQIRPGRLAPFVVWDETANFDVVCVVAELRSAPDAASEPLRRLASQIKQTLMQALELHVTRVEFVAAGALPVTTSGKVRASETQRRYLRGELPFITG